MYVKFRKNSENTSEILKISCVLCDFVEEDLGENGVIGYNL